MELLSLRFAGGVPAEQASLDLLCIAPHPDDAELGMGAVLAQESARGLGVGILDLSRGELASNGTPEQRLQESAEAARILGLRWRGNLGLRDRALEGPNAQEALITALRVLRPVALFIPHPRDPHPDHGAAHRLCLEAWFSAGLRRVLGQGGSPTRPRVVLQYFINGWAEPGLVVDATRGYERKLEAIAAHTSQFGPGEAATRLNQGGAVGQVQARDRFLGAAAGVAWAEGFVPVGAPLVSSPSMFWA